MSYQSLTLPELHHVSLPPKPAWKRSSSGAGQPDGSAVIAMGVAITVCANDESNVSGFIHLDVLPAADAESLHGMVLEKIRPGTRLLTDGLPSYRGLGAKGYDHQPCTSPGGQAASLQWPLVHRAISNCNRWLIGTHRNFCLRHLPDYVAEFC